MTRFLTPRTAGTKNFSDNLCRSQKMTIFGMCIPPNTSLFYELELLEVQEPIDYSTITEAELVTYL